MINQQELDQKAENFEKIKKCCVKFRKEKAKEYVIRRNDILMNKEINKINKEYDYE